MCADGIQRLEMKPGINPDSFKDVKEGGVCLSFGRADSVKDRWHAIELQSRDADDSDEANEFA